MSKTNEKSILLTELTVLTKSHRPPPEKFIGIADTELKYRKRYLDLMSSEESRARFMVRTEIIRAIRLYMDRDRFVEVETSTLNTISSGANAKPFITHHNALETDLYLRIAPELYLKRLLVGGFERVYEIGRNYRNEGISTRHNPEFTMMEAYKAYGKFDELVSNTEELIVFINDHLLEKFSGSFVAQYLNSWIENRPFALEFKRVPMVSAVFLGLEKAGLNLVWNPDSTDIQVINVSLPANERLQKINLYGLFEDFDKCESVGAKIGLLFEYVAEPFLTEDYRTRDDKHSLPVFITEYPKEMCPLARANDLDPKICDRFELYINGQELANGFQELNDPDEQAFRFKEQLANNDKDPMDYDSDYVEALEYGMPPTIGYGVGVDRLAMAFTNAESIKDVILFPTLKPKN